MRRDMDLVRDILLACSRSADGTVDASSLSDGQRSRELVAYHIDIMVEAGLIHGNVTRAFGDDAVVAKAGPLTWEGNEFLDAVSSDSVWRQVKAKLGETVKSATLDVIKALAVKLTQQALGL